MNTCTRSVITGEEQAALSYLPERCAAEVRRVAALWGGMINEIRLRSGGVLSVTVMGENIPCRVTVTADECAETFLRLCRGSVYSETENVLEGFVTTPEGIRAGICGRAVTSRGEIRAVNGVWAICIRIPRRVPGAGDVAYELLREMNFRKSLIVWSLPGIGKTTLLRELTVRLGSGRAPLRVAVIDTRHEIGAGIRGIGLVDILDGYPRVKGMEIARRTLSPQIIICDEIATADDVSAVLDAASCGIPVVATVHAGRRESLYLTDHLVPLVSSDGLL